MASLHPTIHAWQRDAHEGHYTAELHDWTLLVKWRPNTPQERGGFAWEADREGDKKRLSPHAFEEMEEAMGHAEDFARRDAEKRSADIAKAAEAEH